MGWFNGVQQNSSIGCAGILGGDVIGPFWIGTGFSGMIICIFRMICLASFPDKVGLGIQLNILKGQLYTFVSLQLGMY